MLGTFCKNKKLNVRIYNKIIIKTIGFFIYRGPRFIYSIVVENFTWEACIGEYYIVTISKKCSFRIIIQLLEITVKTKFPTENVILINDNW